MFIPIFAGSGSSSSDIVVDAADFDSLNDYMIRGAGLTGAVDSKKGIISFWFRLDGGDGITQRLVYGTTTLGGTTPHFHVERTSLNKITMRGVATGIGSIIFEVITTSTYSAGATWNHFLASWDMSDPAARSLYVNDISDLSVITFIDGTIDYTLADWAIGAAPSGGLKLNGCLAEVYFAADQYLDFSVISNRRKFISSNGKPVYLGADGSLPTGVAPLIYQHLDNGEAVANFATNRGTGGNFTITGTLDTASTSPSD